MNDRFYQYRPFAAVATYVSHAERLCENYRDGGKTTKTAEFMASLVELSHEYTAIKKRAAPMKSMRNLAKQFEKSNKNLVRIACNKIACETANLLL